MANQLTRYATVATVDTAGEGYFFGISINFINPTGGVAIGSNDETRVYQFVLPFRVVVRKIITEVTIGGVAGKFYGVGLYDVNGTRVVTTGAIDAEAVAITTTTITAVTLEPGVYFQAQTSDDNATQFRRFPAVGEPLALINETGALIGTAANTSTAGVLPATLGTITKSTTRVAIVAVFSP